MLTLETVHVKSKVEGDSAMVSRFQITKAIARG
jgi:hypothetical protein